MKKLKAFLLTKSVGLYINALSYVAPRKAFQMAYVFFSNPRAGKLHLENLPKILQASDMETLTLDGHSIQTYRWQGNETVILLMHGWESNSDVGKNYFRFYKKLAARLSLLMLPHTA